MRKIVYASRAAVPFDSDALRALLVESRANNATAELTGLLIFSEGSFLQLLEGPEDAVADVYQRIMADPRHTDFRVLSDERIAARRFPEWSMGFEDVAAEDLARALPGYRRSAFPLADPETLVDGALAETLLAIYGGSS